MRSRYQSKYLKINPKRPTAAGACDRTGFVFNHHDLVKQMEWRGNNLVWTGLMVGRPFLDLPQPQLRPPPVTNDPQPVKNPRPILAGPPSGPTGVLLAEQLRTVIFK